MDNLNALIIIVPESEVNEVDVRYILEYLEDSEDDYFVVCTLLPSTQNVDLLGFGHLSDAVFSQSQSTSSTARLRATRTDWPIAQTLHEYLAARNIQYVDIIGFDLDECRLVSATMEESGYKATIVPVRSSSTNTASLILPPDLEKVANDLLYSNIRERPTADSLDSDRDVSPANTHSTQTNRSEMI